MYQHIIEDAQRAITYLVGVGNIPDDILIALTANVGALMQVRDRFEREQELLLANNRELEARRGVSADLREARALLRQTVTMLGDAHKLDWEEDRVVTYRQYLLAQVDQVMKEV